MKHEKKQNTQIASQTDELTQTKPNCLNVFQKPGQQRHKKRGIEIDANYETMSIVSSCLM